MVNQRGRPSKEFWQNFKDITHPCSNAHFSGQEGCFLEIQKPRINRWKRDPGQTAPQKGNLWPIKLCDRPEALGNYTKKNIPLAWSDVFEKFKKILIYHYPIH